MFRLGVVKLYKTGMPDREYRIEYRINIECLISYFPGNLLKPKWRQINLKKLKKECFQKFTFYYYFLKLVSDYKIFFTPIFYQQWGLNNKKTLYY